jgi:DnaJ-class molecular chaperone
MKYIYDASDFCRSCKGKGYFSDKDPRTGITVSDDCLHCNGTGFKAIVILEEEEKYGRKH